jgi:hypothetical protein
MYALRLSACMACSGTAFMFTGIINDRISTPALKMSDNRQVPYLNENVPLCICLQHREALQVREAWLTQCDTKHECSTKEKKKTENYFSKQYIYKCENAVYLY